MMKYIASATALVLLVVIVIFAIQNLAIVEMRFLSLSMSVPAFVMVLGSYVLGTITGGSVVAVLKKVRRAKKPAAEKVA